MGQRVDILGVGYVPRSGETDVARNGCVDVVGSDREAGLGDGGAVVVRIKDEGKVGDRSLRLEVGHFLGVVGEEGGDQVLDCVGRDAGVQILDRDVDSVSSVPESAQTLVDSRLQGLGIGGVGLQLADAQDQLI